MATINARARWVSFAVALLAASSSGGARAQTPLEGFALDRFEPSERGSDWFVNESFDLRGHRRLAAGLVFDYARKPLVVYSANDAEVASAVEHQLFLHPGASLMLWDRARFALSLPIAVVQDGEPGTAGTNLIAADDSAALGDLRLGADVRLVGSYAAPFQLVAGAQLYAPTGSQNAYTSDGTVRFVPRLGVAGELGPLVYAAQLGLHLRRKSAYAGTERGSELGFAAAAGTKLLHERVLLGLELSTSTVIADADGFFARRSTPVELLLGWHFRASDTIRVNAGVGPGLTRALGTPQFRGLASLEWVDAFAAPELPPADRDHDTVLDRDDACPDVPGERTTDPKTNGCPPPPDRDRDSILDDVDACPDIPGVASHDPHTNGCPDRDSDGIPDTLDACPDAAGKASDDPKTNGCPDRDGDGILDPVDACPEEPGIASEDPKKHGCPPPKDSDGDGIIDPEDACPKDAGPPNPDPKKHGCPVARVEKGQIVIREQIQFAYNSAQILKTSEFILEAVQKVLSENPEIHRLSIEGHTDSKGSAPYNKQLSQRRAQAVVDWLTRKGIKKSALEAHGYGKERPLDTNDTEEGRANNRRVEFHILEQAPTDGARAPQPTPAQ